MTIEEIVDLEMSEKSYDSQYIKPDLTDIFLAHHQALGAHWGIMNGPPYPLSRKLSTGKRLKPAAKGVGSVEKKKSDKKSFAEKRKAKKVYKKRVAAAQKARETKARKAEEARAKAAEEERKAKEAQEAQDRAEKEQLEREQWKRDVINRGDAKTASEHTDLFSNQEIQEIIDRYHATDKLSQVVADANPPDPTPEQKDKLEVMREKVDKIQKFAGTVSDLANSAKKVYDAVNTVNEILNSGGKKQEAANKQSEEARKAKEDAWKKNVIMNRDKATMMANKNRFTSDEIQKLLNNIEADKKLANEISGEKKEETKAQSNQQPQPKEQQSTSKPSNPQPSKSEESQKQSKPQQSPYVQQPKQNVTAKPDLSPSLMDKVMARAQNAAAAQRSSNERQNRDRAYFQQQSTEVLKLMKQNMEEDGVAASQINLIDDILKDRRKRGR